MGDLFFGGILGQKTASLNFCTPEVWWGIYFLAGILRQKTASLNFCTPENTPLRPLREVFCGDEKLITQLKQGSRAHAAADAHGFHTVFHAFVLHIGEQGGTEF